MGGALKGLKSGGEGPGGGFGKSEQRKSELSCSPLPAGRKNTIKGEFKLNGVQNDLSHVTGVISMARLSTPLDSATSQFFICNADASRSLDGSYAAFGYVVAGLDVVLTVSEVEVKANIPGYEVSVPVNPVVMEKICFVTPN